jgi:hypothetical protein
MAGRHRRIKRECLKEQAKTSLATEFSEKKLRGLCEFCG